MMHLASRNRQFFATLVLALVVLAACAGNTPTPEAEVDEGPVVTVIVTATPAPTATITPTPTPNQEVDLVVSQARAALLAGDAGQALSMLDEVLEAYPDSAKVYFAQAEVLLALGDPAAAFAGYEAGLTLAPDSEAGWQAYADAALAVEDYETHIRALNGLMVVRPTDAEIVAKRGQAYLRLGELDAAADDFVRVQDVYGDAVENFWLWAVSDFYNAQDYLVAFDVAARGAAEVPTSSRLPTLQGLAALTLQDNESAILAYSVAIENDINSFEAYRFRGLAYLLEEDYTRAIPDLEMAVALGENAGVTGQSVAFEAMSDLGFAMSIEDTQAGLIYLDGKERFYALNYGLLPGGLLTGRARIYANTNRPDAALELLDRAIQRNYVDGYYYRATVWQQIDDIGRARRDLETYLELRPAGFVSEWARALLAQLPPA